MRTMRLARRTHYLLLLGSVSLLPACSDAPSAPEMPGVKKVPIATRDVSYQAGSQLTVVDQSGGTLTLDAATHEIRTNDGRFYLLSTEQTAEMATDFQNTITYDRLANAADGLPPSGCGEGGCIEPTGGWETSCDLSGSCDGPTTSGLQPKPIVRLVSSSQLTSSQTGVFGMTVRQESPQTTQPKRKGGKGGTGTATILDFILLPDCESLRGSILTAVAAYRNERAGATGRMLHNGFTGFVWEAVRGRWVQDLAVPAANGFWSSILADVVNKKMSEASLSIMRVLYTSQGCGTISWEGPGGGGSFSGFGLRCTKEVWQISFDGGQSWRNIYADVCEYRTS